MIPVVGTMVMVCAYDEYPNTFPEKPLRWVHGSLDCGKTAWIGWRFVYVARRYRHESKEVAMRKQLFVTVVSVLFSAAALAGGQSSNMKSEHMQPAKGAAYGANAAAYNYGFEKLDENRDGVISQIEAQTYKNLRKEWEHADKNGDNKIDRAEFSAFEKSHGESNTK
jgi:hypothetical protein